MMDGRLSLELTQMDQMVSMQPGFGAAVDVHLLYALMPLANKGDLSLACQTAESNAAMAHFLTPWY